MKNVIRTTKKDVLNAMKAYFEANDVDLGTVTVDEALDYINTTIGQLDDKAVKAKAKAAEKKEKGDSLKDYVYSLLTNDVMTVDELVAKIVESNEFEDVTRSKVISRLTALVKSGKVSKEDVKVDNRSLKGYRLSAEDAE